MPDAILYHMEERVKTSFIPKASLKVETAPGTRRKSPIALVNIIAGALLVIAILAAAAIYLFQGYTLSQIQAKQDSLNRDRAAFQPSTIQELARLDTRINAAEALLKQHVALSKLFGELETDTLSSVAFSDFTYAATDATHVSIAANGQAKSFNAVALQSDAFSSSTIITEPVFTNVNIDKTGIIGFQFTATANLSRMLYTGAATPFATSSPALQPSSSPASGQPSPSL